jgi:hypothetical protein
VPQHCDTARGSAIRAPRRHKLDILQRSKKPIST